MSIIKTFLPDKGICKVAFTLPELATNQAHKVSIVGDFNSWNPNKNLMKKDKNGLYKGTIELPLGKLYQFRYLVDDNQWVNEWDADAYSPTPYGNEYNMILSSVAPE
jgi:1,4-alpha-glucan branching enzyme